MRLRSVCLLLLLCGCMESQADQVIVAKKPSGCTPSYGPELATKDNAVELGGTETDATTGWASVTCTFDSIDTAPYSGNYHFTGTPTGNNGRFYRSFAGLSTATLYVVSAYVRHSGTGGNWKLGLGGWPHRNLLIIATSDTTYKEYRSYFVYNTTNGRYDGISFMEYNASDDGTVYLDALSIKTASPCLGSEIHTNNAAVRGSGEVDSTTGWTAHYNATISSTSSGTPQDGTYHILCETNTTPTNLGSCYFDLNSYCTTGKKYLIRMWIKHVGSGGEWTACLSSSNYNISPGSVAPFVADYISYTTYQEWGVSFTYDTYTRYLLLREHNTSNDGGLYVDGITIKEITAE